jgi:hypothetical protein
MPEPVSAGIAVASSIGSAVVQGNAAKRAGRAQARANDQAIAEQRRQFDTMQRLLSPYVNAGGPALAGLMDIAGIGGQAASAGGAVDFGAYVQANPDLMAEFNRVQGQFGGDINAYGQFHYDRYGRNEGRDITPFTSQATEGMSAADAQARAFGSIENSPGFQALARQGEEAILQNASATGGLRGGNTQGALARFRPQLLDQFIERQFGRMAGIAQSGQNAAAGVGSAGMNMGANIGQIMQGTGKAQAGAIGAQGQIYGNLIGNIGGMFSGGMQRGPQAALMPSVQATMNQNPGIF